MQVAGEGVKGTSMSNATSHYRQYLTNQNILNENLDGDQFLYEGLP